jgi:hypothetical protein
MQSMAFTSRKINTAFSRAAMKTLLELGPSVPSSILYYLEQRLGVSSDQIFEDPIRFAKALEGIFSLGSPLIEDKILQHMCEELGIEHEKSAGTFEEKIHQIYESNESKRNAPIFQIMALEQTMHHHA